MSLIDVIAGLGAGGSATIDARDQRRSREAREAEEAARRKLTESRQRAFFTRLQELEGPDTVTPIPGDPIERGMGPDPEQEAVGFDQGEAPPVPRPSPASRFAEFDPTTDYATEYDVTRQRQNDARQQAADAERQRLAQAKAEEDERTRAANERNNRVAYETAKRLGAPEAAGDFDPAVDYGDVFTRYNQEQSGQRAEASASRAASSAARSAEAAARQAEIAATRLAAETRRNAQADAQVRARGAILQSTLGRYPAEDQAAIRSALDTVREAQPDLDDAVIAGIVAQQFESGLLPGQRVRIRPGGTPGAPPGQVPVEDDALAEEILRMRGGGGE